MMYSIRPGDSLWIYNEYVNISEKLDNLSSPLFYFVFDDDDHGSR